MLPDMEFNITSSATNLVEIELNLDPTVKIDFDVGVEYGQGGRLPDYKGSYEVIPKLIDQTLPTKDKSMTDDVVVKEVPVARVTNPAHGKTVTICAL